MLDDDETEAFSPQERAALRYAEQLVKDAHGVSEDDYDTLRRHFTDAELVELGVLIALCIGFDKLISTWNLTPESCGLDWL